MGKNVNQFRFDILMTQNALESCPLLTLNTLPKYGAVSSAMWVMVSMKLADPCAT